MGLFESVSTAHYSRLSLPGSVWGLLWNFFVAQYLCYLVLLQCTVDLCIRFAYPDTANVSHFSLQNFSKLHGDHE